MPRIYEKMHSAVLNGVAEQGRVKRALFALGDRRGRARACGRPRGTPLGRLAAARHRLADTLVLSKVRALFGDRLAMALCGAAPVAPEVLEFFDACGVLVLEGYGMTETCAAATLNTPRAVRFGSVGRPLAGTEVAIADDGEILMAGPHVFSGYHRDPAATSEVLDGRWLRSGDLGEIDADGYLHITGRKKDLIITSSGKNISPENLESALRETRWISQAVVVGDRRSYLVALLTLDPDEAPKLAEELGIPADLASMAADERVRELVAARGRRGQRAVRARRADQALRHPRPRPLAGGGRAHADPQGQAARDPRALRRPHRAALRVVSTLDDTERPSLCATAPRWSCGPCGPRIASCCWRASSGSGPESRYQRFLAPMAELTDDIVTYLTDVDHHDHEALRPRSTRRRARASAWRASSAARDGRRRPRRP